MDVVTYAIGAISLVYGVMRMVSFFRNRSVSFLFVGDLILGIVLLGIGIFSFTNPGGIFAFLPFGALVITVRILGIILIVDGITGLWVGHALRGSSF